MRFNLRLTRALSEIANLATYLQSKCCAIRSEQAFSLPVALTYNDVPNYEHIRDLLKAGGREFDLSTVKYDWEVSYFQRESAR